MGQLPTWWYQTEHFFLGAPRRSSRIVHPADDARRLPRVEHEAGAEALLPHARRVLDAAGGRDAVRAREAAQGLLRAHRAPCGHAAPDRVVVPRQHDVHGPGRVHEHGHPRRVPRSVQAPQLHALRAREDRHVRRPHPDVDVRAAPAVPGSQTLTCAQLLPDLPERDHALVGVEPV
jgi:hypothetical protein